MITASSTLDDIELELPVDELDIDALIAARATQQETVALPPVVARVNEAVASGAKIPEVTRLVELDPSLAANVARLARSAAYTGAVGEKVSVPYAVMRLGAEGVRAVSLTSTLAKLGLRPGPMLAMRRKLWRECIASALACEALAPSHGASPHHAYLLGLLHDYGKVLALSIVEDELAPAGDAGEARGPLGALAGAIDPFWVEVAERHHCDVGWIAAEAWHMPGAIPSITATHHVDTDRALVAAAHDALRDVVGVADRVVGAAAARGWQISAEDIERIEGVASRDEAMAVRIALAKHPYFLTAVL